MPPFPGSYLLGDGIVLKFEIRLMKRERMLGTEFKPRGKALFEFLVTGFVRLPDFDSPHFTA